MRYLLPLIYNFLMILWLLVLLFLILFLCLVILVVHSNLGLNMLVVFVHSNLDLGLRELVPDILLVREFVLVVVLVLLSLVVRFVLALQRPAFLLVLLVEFVVVV